MAKIFIKAAIDHGTTNSAIALMESNGPRVIKPDGVNPIMPSAVYINKRGRRLVGWPAYNAILTEKAGEGTGHMRYKPRIGQDERYAFDEARKVMTAPELGGVVMAELLKAAYWENDQQEIKACVVTVPAKFEENARNGTQEAARRAGLLYAPLLQEPIAAALAYGFTAEADKANWMVFDLGGGTLDVSLVIVRKGKMEVPPEGHAGDNWLGGSKFDRELMDYVLGVLGKQFDLKGFGEKNPKYKSVWGRLLLAIEEAKIELSKRNEATVEVDGVLCDDNKGKPVKVDVPITREMYERRIAPDIEKAVHICQTLISTNRLTPKDIDGLILVGGPTKTPYIQQVLADRLGIPLHKEIDPMTAVAQGGAIYATTLEVPEEIKKQIAVPEDISEGINVTIEYEKASRQPTYHVAGKIGGQFLPDGKLFVEIKRADGGWRSGRVPLTEKGTFSVELLLLDARKPHLSRFTTTVLDESGKVLVTVNEPEIWYPFPEGGGRVASSLRVALKGNETEVLVERGAELPARGEGTFETIKALRKGSGDDLLKIPILETVTHLLGAEDDHADCNVHIGSILVEGSHKGVTADVPVGAEIDLTLEMNETGGIDAVAYIPLLDAEFEASFTREPFGITVKDVEQRLYQENGRLEEVRKLQSQSPLDSIATYLKQIDSMKVVEDIGKDIERAHQQEGDACYRAWKRVLELAGAINMMRDEQMQVRIQHHFKNIRKGASEKDLKQIDELEKQLEALQSNTDPSRLRAVEQALDEVDARIRRRPYYTLHLYISALAGLRVTQEQYRVHKEALDLLEKVDKNGAPETLTNKDIQKIEEKNEEIISAYPDLQDHVKKFLQGLPEGADPEDAFGSSIKKKSQ